MFGWLTRRRIVVLLMAGAAGVLAVRRQRAGGVAEVVTPPPPRPVSPRPTQARPAASAPVPARSPSQALAGTSARAGDDGAAPSAEYTVKAKQATKRCHGPDSPYYARTKADLWFRSVADAEAAGFTPWRPVQS